MTPLRIFTEMLAPPAIMLHLPTPQTLPLFPTVAAASVSLIKP